MKTYHLFFVSVYRFIWNTFLYDISSILLIIIFKLIPPKVYKLKKSLFASYECRCKDSEGQGLWV